VTRSPDESMKYIQVSISGSTMESRKVSPFIVGHTSQIVTVVVVVASAVVVVVVVAESVSVVENESVLVAVNVSVSVS